MYPGVAAIAIVGTGYATFEKPYVGDGGGAEFFPVIIGVEIGRLKRDFAFDFVCFLATIFNA